MSYTTVLAAVQSIIQALDDYDDGDVTRGDYRVFSRGSPPYAILGGGAFERGADVHPQGRMNKWVIPIELYEQYAGDGSELDNIVAHRQTLIDTFDGYPTLNALGNITRCMITAGETVRRVSFGEKAGQGPYWLLQEMTLEVFEKSTASGGEYA